MMTTMAARVRMRVGGSQLQRGSTLPRTIGAGATTTTTIRRISTDAQPQPSSPTPPQNPQGDISSLFPSLSGRVPPPLPPRFAEIKSRLIADTPASTLQSSWDRLLPALSHEIDLIATHGSSIIPQISLADIPSLTAALTSTSTSGTPSPSCNPTLAAIRHRGVVVIKNVIPEAEALDMLAQTRRYMSHPHNRPHLRGFPASAPSPSVFEVYWSPGQIRARTHPGMLTAQRFLHRLWDAPHPTSHPLLLSYADRLRIRPPGDTHFSLGAHVDNGSVERLEDPVYASVYGSIFRGQWEAHNPWGNVGPRSRARMNLHGAKGGCSVWRMWQGWLSLSHTAEGEGTLRVVPLLGGGVVAGYVLLRGFFREEEGGGRGVLKDPMDAQIPLAGVGGAHEFSARWYPRLGLEEEEGRAGGMVSVPRVGPGDYVAWHCDVIHAVERVHRGCGESCVFYIPVVPCTEENRRYVRAQREVMEWGGVPRDFPGGEEGGGRGSGSGNGEEGWVGRGGWGDVCPGETEEEARRMLGWGL